MVVEYSDPNIPANFCNVSFESEDFKAGDCVSTVGSC
jgi:hypothetical protein